MEYIINNFFRVIFCTCLTTFLECRLASGDFGIMRVGYEIENWAFLFDLEPLPRGKLISPMVPGQDADHQSSILWELFSNFNISFKAFIFCTKSTFTKLAFFHHGCKSIWQVKLNPQLYRQRCYFWFSFSPTFCSLVFSYHFLFNKHLSNSIQDLVPLFTSPLLPLSLNILPSTLAKLKPSFSSLFLLFFCFFPTCLPSRLVLKRNFYFIYLLSQGMSLSSKDCHWTHSQKRI